MDSEPVCRVSLALSCIEGLTCLLILISWDIFFILIHSWKRIPANNLSYIEYSPSGTPAGTFTTNICQVWGCCTYLNLISWFNARGGMNMKGASHWLSRAPTLQWDQFKLHTFLSVDDWASPLTGSHFWPLASSFLMSSSSVYTLTPDPFNMCPSISIL